MAMPRIEMQGRRAWVACIGSLIAFAGVVLLVLDQPVGGLLAGVGCLCQPTATAWEVVVRRRQHERVWE
jgi:drug/metabolite transporter (DMT)-like permease